MSRGARLRLRYVVLRLLSTAAICVLVVAAWVADRPRTLIALTWQGHRVVNGRQLLNRAEQQLAAEITMRHGASASSARCYFLTTTGSPDMAAELRCGPALFVDGDPQRPYVSYPLQAEPTKDDRIRLVLAQAGSGQSATGPIGNERLVRPDRRQASGSVQPPGPPTANPDVLTVAAVVGEPLSTAASQARMVGADTGVQLTRFGFVTRYGVGDGARSAPPGRRLLAFMMRQIPGESGVSGQTPPSLSISVGGQTRGPLLIPAGYVVTSVPADAPDATLTLSDGGITQRLSLTTGRPSPDNPLITGQPTRTSTLTASRSVVVQVTAHGKTGLSGGVIRFTGLRLSYWAPDGSHAQGPTRALLHVAVTLQLDGDRKPYGADASLLRVQLPDGQRLSAHNAAPDVTQQIDDVVDVPASTTRGILIFSGTVNRSGGSLTVGSPTQIAFTINDR